MKFSYSAGKAYSVGIILLLVLTKIFGGSTIGKDTRIIIFLLMVTLYMLIECIESAANFIKK